MADHSHLSRGEQQCFGCELIKPIEDFYSDKGFHRRYCASCVGIATKIRKRNIKAKWIDELGNACQHCGFKLFSSSIHFHHVEDDKDYTPSKIIYSEAKEELARAELDKCCLLCANCHYALHGRELSLTFVKREKLGFTTKEKVK